MMAFRIQQKHTYENQIGHKHEFTYLLIGHKHSVLIYSSICLQYTNHMTLWKYEICCCLREFV